jgi:hypothetical protein
MNIISDLAQRVGGVLALVGALLGAWLNSSTTCTSSLTGGPRCHNAFGDVALNAVGEPNLEPLIATGAAVGAVIGALLAWLIVAILPHTKADLV